MTGVPIYDDEDESKLVALVPCPFVMGIGKIEGRRIAIHGDDFTIKGASVGRMYKSKGAYFVKMARSLKLPMVRLIEGAGGSIKEILEIGYTELPSSGDECAQDRVEVMSEIPVIFRHLCSTFQLNTIHAVFRIRLLPNPHFPIVLN